MQHSKLAILAAGLLSVFFVTSGIGKMLDITQFADTIGSYGFPQFRFSAPLIAAGEIGLGLAFLLRVQLRRVALIGTLVLIAFTLLFAYGYLRHGVTDCGCFGALEALQTPAWISFVRNGLLIGLTCWLSYSIPPSEVAVSPRQVGLIGGMTIAALTVGGHLYSKSNLQARPTVKAGQAVKGSALAPFVTQGSTCVVFIFSPTCSHCWQATPTVLRYQSSGLVGDIVALCPPSTPKDQQKYLQHFNSPFTIRTVAKANLYKLTNRVPTVIFVRNDTIAKIFNSKLPSPDSLLALSKLAKLSPGVMTID